MLLAHATTCNNKYNMLVLQITPLAIGYTALSFGTPSLPTLHKSDTKL